MDDHGGCPKNIDHYDRSVEKNLGTWGERHELNIDMHVAKIAHLLANSS